MITRVIPCLDVLHQRVIKGRCFRGLVDLGDPVCMAQRYCEEGADELAVLNVSASRGQDTNNNFCNLINSIARKVHVPLIVGGGIDSLEKVRSLLNSGADKVSLNSSAIAKATLLQDIASVFGVQCVVVAVDVTKKIGKNSWEVRTHSGSLPSDVNVIEWAKEVSYLGAGEILLTSIDRDGTQSGFDIPLVASVGRVINLSIIASGGGGNCLDCVEVTRLSRTKAIILASILHSNKRTVSDIKCHFGSYETK